MVGRWGGVSFKNVPTPFEMLLTSGFDVGVRASDDVVESFTISSPESLVRNPRAKRAPSSCHMLDKRSWHLESARATKRSVDNEAYFEEDVSW